MNKKVKVIIVLAVVALFGIATLSFAGWGRGYGHMMGPGWGHMGGYGYGPERYSSNLSKEEIEKLEKQRAEYFKATENSAVLAQQCDRAGFGGPIEREYIHAAMIRGLNCVLNSLLVSARKNRH